MKTSQQDSQTEATPSPIEMLTIEEFVERMKISRTTAFQWIREGVLIQGQHYIKIGRILRFPWGPGLVQALKKTSLESRVILTPCRKKRKTATTKSAINLEYH